MYSFHLQHVMMDMLENFNLKRTQQGAPFQITQVKEMAQTVNKNYLEDELSGEEDASLTREPTYSQRNAKYKIPPGIRTLSQWGQQVIPSGKQAGKTFEKVFMEDDGYLMQIRNRKAVSAWMLSLQNYRQAMIDHRHRAQLPEQIKDMKNHSQKVKEMTSGYQNKPMGSRTDDWEQVDSVKTVHRSKREKAESSKEVPRKMMVEPNQERVESLQTQIAILQRELAQETQVPEDQ